MGAQNLSGLWTPLSMKYPVLPEPHAIHGDCGINDVAETLAGGMTSQVWKCRMPGLPKAVPPTVHISL